MLNKKKLEIILSKLKEVEDPRIELEQYTIPSDLAAEILNIAYLSGHIEDKVILDLGCGSGRLTIGAVLMDAKKVIGVDVDERTIETVKENIKIASNLSNIKIQEKIELFCMDVSKWKRRIDTVIQNPPFGIQKLHADRVFLKKALECAKYLYSLHRHYEKSREFLTKFIENNGGKVEKIIKFKFRIPYMFKFHKKPYVRYEVDLFIISRV
jgi:putative methylase